MQYASGSVAKDTAHYRSDKGEDNVNADHVSLNLCSDTDHVVFYRNQTSTRLNPMAKEFVTKNQNVVTLTKKNFGKLQFTIVQNYGTMEKSYGKISKQLKFLNKIIALEI